MAQYGQLTLGDDDGIELGEIGAPERSYRASGGKNKKLFFLVGVGTIVVALVLAAVAAYLWLGVAGPVPYSSQAENDDMDVVVTPVAPAPEAPAPEAPAPEAPAPEAPAPEAPAPEAPAPEAPAPEAPAQAPAPEAPAPEAPAPEAPAPDSPAPAPESPEPAPEAPIPVVYAPPFGLPVPPMPVSSNGVAVFPKEWNTHEYQIKLNKTQWEADRTSQIHAFIDFLSTHSPLQFTYEDGYEFVREQYNVHNSKCVPDGEDSPTVRVRNLIHDISGNSPVNHSYVDVKEILHHYKDYSSERIPPEWPAVGQENAFLKKEQDVHPCHSRFSRATRVFNVPFRQEWHTCADIVALFPYIYGNATALLDKKIDVTSKPEIWWELTHTGLMGDIPYQSSFTIKYPSVQAAIDGVGIKEGRSTSEWSLRLQASDVWEESEELRVNVLEWFLEMSRQFDEQQEECLE